MRRTSALAVLLAIAGGSPAHAYDQHWTHPWLTRMSVAHLVATYPGQYDELAAHVDDVAYGAQEEDDFLRDGDEDPTTLRVMRHFYRPTDDRGLSYGDRLFPSSYVWCAIPNAENEWDWGDGLRQYRRGEIAEAYVTLGHVAHLIQDATVPAHTHLDAHGPPDGDDYESYVSSRFAAEDVTDLPRPAPGTPIPDFADPYQAWQATAWASYRANLFAADLTVRDDPRGELVDMFPDLHWSGSDETWAIDAPPVGELGRGFLEAEPFLYYVKNAEHAPAGGVPLVEGFAEELIPVAILHGAAVMKLYLDQAYAQAPELPDETPELPPAAAGACAVGGGDAPFPASIAIFVGALALISFLRRRIV